MASETQNESTGLENGLSEKQFNFGYWYTTHKPQLYIALLVSIIIFDLSLGGYNLYKWGDYLINGYANDQKLAVQIAQSLSNPTVLRDILGPKELVVQWTNVFPGTATVDVVSIVKNPNPKYIAYFDYDFGAGGNTKQAFLLPNEEKPVAELGIKGIGITDATLEIKNIKWQHVDMHQIKDINAFINDRLTFSNTGFKFMPAYRSGLKDNSVSFNVSNDTFFNFWQADFWVILKVNETPVGIERLALDNFRSTEKRDVTLTISAGISPNNIQLVPDIDVFDPKSFLR